MKIFFVENETGMSPSYIMDSLKQAIQERMPEFQNDAVFSLAYEREDQFFLKSPEAILWGKVYFESVHVEDLDIFKNELKKLSGIFRRKIVPFVFFADDAGSWPCEFGKLTESCFAFSFIQTDGKRALALRKIPVFLESKITENPESKSKIVLKSYEKTPKPFQLSREELSELIDLSLELRSLN